MKKPFLFVTGLVLGGVLLLALSRQREATQLRGENDSLRRELEELSVLNQGLSNRLARMEASWKAAFGGPSRGGELSPAQLQERASMERLAQMIQGDGPPRLDVGLLQRFLAENHRNVDSLMAAYRTSGDLALLQEAMQNFPGNPLVAFEAAFRKDLPPAERREWVEALKKAAPGNSLGTYLSALEYFKSGQNELAVQELRVASGQPGFSDYARERGQANEEAYRSAGFTEAEAKMAATWGVELPQLAQMRALGKNMAELAATYRQAGDPGSAQATLDMALALGQRVGGGEGASSPLISRLVGIAIERTALSAMEPTAEFGSGTVQDYLDGLAQRKASIREMVQRANEFQKQMTSEDWLNYNSRTLAFGEENAIGWLTNKYGPGK